MYYFSALAVFIVIAIIAFAIYAKKSEGYRPCSCNEPTRDPNFQYRLTNYNESVPQDPINKDLPTEFISYSVTDHDILV